MTRVYVPWTSYPLHVIRINALVFVYPPLLLVARPKSFCQYSMALCPHAPLSKIVSPVPPNHIEISFYDKCPQNKHVFSFINLPFSYSF